MSVIKLDAIHSELQNFLCVQTGWINEIWKIVPCVSINPRRFPKMPKSLVFSKPTPLTTFQHTNPVFIAYSSKMWKVLRNKDFVAVVSESSQHSDRCVKTFLIRWRLSHIAFLFLNLNKLVRICGAEVNNAKSKNPSCKRTRRKFTFL